MQLAEDPPIACTLDAGTMVERLHRIKALTDADLLSHELTGNQLRLVYQHGATNEVQAVVELERNCCAFLDFVVQEVKRSVVLTISAPAYVKGSAVWLFEHFLPSSRTQASKPACGCGSDKGSG